MTEILLFHECGGPEVLKCKTVNIPVPVNDEVMIKVKAFSLNQADLLYLKGEHTTKNKFPSRIGSEASGIVTAIGPKVKGIKVGDRVSTLPFMTNEYGVQGKFAIVPEFAVVVIPNNLSFIEASSIWMQYLTAYFPLVQVADMHRGDTILIIAGASSAGLGALQLSKIIGLRTILTTRTKEKQGYLYQLGADFVLNSTEPTFSEQLIEITKEQGVKLSFDPVGGEIMSRYSHSLAWNAKIFHYGALSDDADEIPMIDLIRRNAVLYPYSMFNYMENEKYRSDAIQFILKGLSTGALTPIIDKIFAFNDFQLAYKYMLSGNQKGKVVVSVD
jgi:NADPH:quinone reductase-like Zn-dependent oxidoreductase